MCFGFSRQHRRDVRFVGVVEECRQPVVLTLRKRIELVAVTFSALSRQAEPDRPRCVDAILNGLDAVLFLIDAALAVGQCVAMETRGNLLLNRRVRQQVARKLLDRKPVKRQITIDCVDHPVPPPPGVGTRPVFLVTVAVGVPGQIEPVASTALAEVRRVEQVIDECLIPAGVCVGLLRPLLQFFRLWRQADQIEMQSPDERLPFRRRRRYDVFFLQTMQHKSIDVVANPRIVKLRRFGADERLISPVVVAAPFVGGIAVHTFRPVGSLVDPCPDQSDFLRREWPAFIDRRHSRVFVLAEQNGKQRTRPAPAGNDYFSIIATRQRCFPEVETQPGLLSLGPVARVTTRPQDRLDLFHKTDATRTCRSVLLQFFGMR